MNHMADLEEIKRLKEDLEETRGMLRDVTTDSNSAITNFVDKNEKLIEKNEILVEERNHYMKLASGLRFELDAAKGLCKNFETVIRDLKQKDLLVDEGIEHLQHIIREQRKTIADYDREIEYLLEQKGTDEVFLIIENGKVSKIFKAESCAREYLEAENREAYSVESLASMTPYELD